MRTESNDSGYRNIGHSDEYCDHRYGLRITNNCRSHSYYHSDAIAEYSHTNHDPGGDAERDVHKFYDNWPRCTSSANSDIFYDGGFLVRKFVSFRVLSNRVLWLPRYGRRWLLPNRQRLLHNIMPTSFFNHHHIEWRHGGRSCYRYPVVNLRHLCEWVVPLWFGSWAYSGLLSQWV